MSIIIKVIKCDLIIILAFIIYFFYNDKFFIQFFLLYLFVYKFNNPRGSNFEISFFCLRAHLFFSKALL